MRIGELSRKTGVSARSLRYYEQQGLLRADRAANGYREYDGASTVRAANIRELMEAGLTVEDIRESLAQGCLDQPLDTLPLCEGAVRTAADRLAALDQRIGVLVSLRQRLSQQVTQARAAIDQGAAVDQVTGA